VIVDRDMAIPARDGTRLVADIYRLGRDRSLLKLLHRAPYGKHDQVAADSLDAGATQP
jgi:predicted acyl esterase